MPISVVTLVKRKPGLSPEAFREGYENSHARLAVELFGHLWTSYRRHYMIDGHTFGAGDAPGRNGGADDLGFDAMSVYVLRDAAAREEMGRIGRDNWQRLKEDEVRWFDQDRCWSFTTETFEEEVELRRR